MQVDAAAFYEDVERYESLTGVLSSNQVVEFYRTEALRYGGPVLELACGTGRLAIPIAAEGLQVVGLDASRQMLSVAQRKAAESNVKLTLMHGDMRSFDAHGKFRYIFVATNSFSHLYSREDVEGCLGSVKRHLAESGRFVVEVFNPAFRHFVQPSGHRASVATYCDVRSGHRIAVSKSVRYDTAMQIAHETWYFLDEVTGDEQAVALNLRMYYPQEFDALLHYNGFAVEQKYGDHGLGPFISSSRKQILVCTAR
jgi:SAM-dependent methyltransferase